MGKSADIRKAWRTQVSLGLLFPALAFACGDLLFGVDTGSFGSIQVLPAFLSEFAPYNATTKNHVFPTQTKSIMNSVVWPGKFVGTIAFEPLVARLGYRITMMIVGVVQIVALIIQLTAHSWQVFSGGRVIAYFAVECAVSSYLAEISPAELRGFFGGLMYCVVALGNLWGAGMGRAFATETKIIGWLVPVAVQIIPAGILLITMPLCPESPRWLVLKGKKEQAIKALNRLRPKKDADSGVTVMEIELRRPPFMKNKLRTRGGGSISFRGSTSVGPFFFTSVGLAAKSFTYTTMITAVSIACGLIAIALVDLTGRRPLLLAGIALSAIFNAVVGGVGYQSPIPESGINVIVASLTFVVVGNKISNNPFSFLIAAELGGMKMRKKIMAMSLAIDVIFAFILSYSVPYMITALSARVGFIFMSFCAAEFLGVFFFVPELTGRSLEEVDELFDRGLQAWQFKGAETSGIGHMLTELEAHRAATDKAHPMATDEVQDVARDNELVESQLESV